MASGAWAPDLDDVADQMLQMLQIDQTVSEPIMPTEHAYMGVQHYDLKKVKRDFHDLVQRRGFDCRLTTMKTEDQEIEILWVKRSEAIG